ncbi:glycoside hydrolase family 45 protein [Bipolaris zeicola 26-R-13]|uniref:Cellulase n=1 Tax=Cochliobolus carbonum (strain 26-R-13) TaxID=930089 RepID=W6XS32_COCC2|nr:glycoside hydrolase family 45 protein [Bipolaris zeicola 26-R-13]EUC28115.1 glycoside hydrolase family 45 protein [Bipolaris zeicola 26-R-13]
MARHVRNTLVSLHLFALLSHAANLNYSGEAVTTRYWDCCKPSCGWNGKADFSSPVESCTADNKPTNPAAGTGCNGGDAFQCADQQPWAINDTMSYGFAGVYIMPSLTHGGIEDAWCCACYQLDFTSDPLIGKSMIIQASNTAYDITTANRFTLAVPGGNTTSVDGCAKQYGVDQSVFGQKMEGVSSSNDCANLPEALRAGCRWRFDWLQDASFPSANFKRVVCPAEITAKSNCVRNDDKRLASGQTTSAAHSLSPSLPRTMALVAATMLILISV